MTEPTQCARCGHTGVLVGLNGAWVCLICFDKAMAEISRRARRLREQLNQ